jgi:3-hydroxybutyryl-CoA dehydratase
MSDPSSNGSRPGLVRDRPDAMMFSKTISEADVYAFAGITGDFYPAHVDAVYAATQPAGERIAHGILLMGLMSTAAARWMVSEAIDGISYGYDKVRFIRPVLFGDTITVAYAWESDSRDGQKIFANIEAHNQRGEMVGTARHIVWVL